MDTKNNKEYLPGESVQLELKQLLDLPDIKTLGHNLRRMFIDYLHHELKKGVPVYLYEFLHPLNTLFDFLDVAANEIIIDQKKDDNQEENLLQLTTQQRVIGFIVTTISPEKIFLINHVANEGEKEFFDFIITIPDASQIAFTDYEQIISMAALTILMFMYHFITAAILTSNWRRGIFSILWLVLKKTLCLMMASCL